MFSSPSDLVNIDLFWSKFVVSDFYFILFEFEIELV